MMKMGGLWSKFEPFRTASSRSHDVGPNGLKFENETTHDLV